MLMVMYNKEISLMKYTNHTVPDLAQNQEKHTIHLVANLQKLIVQQIVMVSALWQLER